MAHKDPEKRRAYSAQYGKTWYQRNRKKHIQAAAGNKSRAKDKWAAFKSTLACMQCGENHPSTLDFHHVEPSEHKVHRLVADGRFSAAMKEIEKCLVLCANCHRKHHWEEDNKKRQAAEAARAAKVLTKLDK